MEAGPLLSAEIGIHFKFKCKKCKTAWKYTLTCEELK